MSDSEIGKATVEAYHFEYFVDAYEEVTGEKLEVISQPYPYPDFLCQRSDGSKFSVEMTRLEMNRLTEDTRILNRYRRVPPEIIIRIIKERIDKKAISGPDLLLLQLFDGPLADYIPTIKAVFTPEEMCGYGVPEVWIADYTELDAYDNVSLFCLCPERWWGYHEHPSRQNQKPFG